MLNSFYERGFRRGREPETQSRAKDAGRGGDAASPVGPRGLGGGRSARAAAAPAPAPARAHSPAGAARRCPGRSRRPAALRSRCRLDAAPLLPRPAVEARRPARPVTRARPAPRRAARPLRLRASSRTSKVEGKPHPARPAQQCCASHTHAGRPRPADSSRWDSCGKQNRQARVFKRETFHCLLSFFF